MRKLDQPAPANRTALFVSHAAPQDNEFALWISSKLTTAGYRVWVDRRRLRGGDDFWDEINRVLRTETIKQIVVFTPHVTKPGVKKELAIGDIMRGQLHDPGFMIPVRAGDIAFSDAPPEFLRGNILNAYPNWHDCLADLLETLETAGVPKIPTPDSQTLRTLIEAREDGRRSVSEEAEGVLTNWFPMIPPARVRYYHFPGLQDQTRAWLDACTEPHVPMMRLAGSFADPAMFSMAASNPPPMETSYDIAFGDFVTGTELGPYADRGAGSRDISNLLRQHFERHIKSRGLLPFEFANGDTGWYFPDDLIENNRVSFAAPDGRRIRRTVTGKFKKARWHLCLIAKPRIWPDHVFRVHGNIVLSEGGKLLAGEQTHQRRRRLTRSWWNHVWRDRLLAAMHFLACGQDAITLDTGDSAIKISSWPLTIPIPASYEASDPPMPSEEDEEGTVTPTAALDDHFDPEMDDESGEDEA